MSDWGSEVSAEEEIDVPVEEGEGIGLVRVWRGAECDSEFLFLDSGRASACFEGPLDDISVAGPGIVF